MYDKNIIIRTRVTRQMRDEFKRSCEANNTSMSDLLRMWITDYVATNKVATKNKDDVATTKNKNVATHKALTHNVKIIRKKNNKVVATYNRGEIVANKYYDKRAYEIKRC